MAGDFQKQPFRDGTFDAAYAIEATCHAPDRLRTYGEVARVLKPGAYFAGYEWVMTDKYDLKVSNCTLLLLFLLILWSVFLRE